jgi:hypothetical protein
MTIAMLLGNTLLAATHLAARAARPWQASPRLGA